MAVEFNEPEAYVRARDAHPSALSRLFIRTGIVQSVTGAQILIFIVSLLLIACAAYLFRIANEQPPAPTPEQVVL